MTDSTRLGICVICGSRVHKADSHLKTMDGYIHRNCVSQKTMLEA